MAYVCNAKSELWHTKTEPSKRTATAVWQVKSDATTTPAAAEAACVAAGFGIVGSIYPGEPTGSPLRCISRECTPQGETRTMFRVVCEYDTSTTASAFGSDPLDDAPLVDFDGEDHDESYFKDTEDNRAETTAGEPFSDLPKREVACAVLNVSRNVAASASYATYFAFCNMINEGSCTIAGLSFTDGQVKVGVPKLSAIQTRDSYSYRVLTVALKARKEGWDDKYESRGLYEYDDSVFALFPILDADNVPTTVPWPLDEDGAAKGSLTDTGFEIVLKPYERGDLSGLFS